MPAPRWVRSFIQPIAVRDVLHYLIRAADVPPERQPRVRHRRSRRLPLRPAHERLRGRGRAPAAPDRGAAGAHAVARRPVGEPRHADPATPRGADHRVAAVRLRHARARHRRRDPAARRGPAAVPHGRAARARARARGRGRDELAQRRGRGRSERPAAERSRLGRPHGVRRRARAALRRHRRRDVWRVIEGVGGENGWYSFPLAWAIRGWVDKLTGGVGLRRGRRDPDVLHVGDAVDFWRVEAIDRGSFLRLRAEMRLPGRAWLELGAAEAPTAARDTASVPCTSRRGCRAGCTGGPSCPFHDVIFSGMANRITAEAEADAAASTAHELEVTKR